ncbi:MAG: hypothetical protein EAZ92_16635 [Candidatus Kapaibacterium sp.]|nr:MAG: hypothetical protein EAZ92_16635 [Candidatus Kapabacteria bacterium]
MLFICFCIVLLLPPLAPQLSAQQEQRVTEKKTTTDEQGQTHQTSSVTEMKVEEILPPLANIIHCGAFRLPWMYNLNYARAVSSTVAIGGGIEFPTTINGDDINGWGLVGEVRFFPANVALRGFYVAGGLNFHSISQRRIDYLHGSTPLGTMPIVQTRTYDYTPLSLGITTGWVLFAWRDLAIDLGLGVKHHLISAQSLTTNPYGFREGLTNMGPEIFTGTAPTVRINIGYAW